MVCLVTGGAGFIGSNFLNLFVRERPDVTFVNLDGLNYAANLQSLEPIQDAPNYRFVQADLADAEAVQRVVSEFQPDRVMHFAAETHVDRSIKFPRDFLNANVVGTFNLLEACRTSWTSLDGKLFQHISTDEVFGSLEHDGAFREDTAYDPSSPYSASKAASDHYVRAYHRTYGLPVKVTNCSNNYGPRQFPEKLIPLMILNAADGKPLPVYGTGMNVRDWLFVDDHCRALWQVAEHGRVGETYCIGGGAELPNVEVVRQIASTVANRLGKDPDAVAGQITFVADRPGHDFRYAIDSEKIRSELGWAPQESFATGLAQTVDWYLSNPSWIDNVRSGAYRQWLETNYAGRGGHA